MEHHRVVLVALGLAVLALAAGCGGGGGENTLVPQAVTVEGYVLAPAADAADAVTAAAQPAASCPVTVTRTSDAMTLAGTTTDQRGYYCVAGLQTHEEIRISAQLHDGSGVSRRLRPRDQVSRADVDESTTLADAAQETVEAAGSTDAEVTGAINQLCEQYQRRYAYRYRGAGAGRPDFSEPDDVAAAAAELIEAGTDWALAEALRTRDAADCLLAVQAMEGWLWMRGGVGSEWGALTRSRLAGALASGTRTTVSSMAGAATAALGTPVGEGDLRQLRDRVRDRLQCLAGGGDGMEVCEGVTALCTGDRTRLRTADQLRLCIDAALAG